ncbi:hypothetical protein STEG23_008522, partial [Scotinomys teguina]
MLGRGRAESGVTSQTERKQDDKVVIHSDIVILKFKLPNLAIRRSDICDSDICDSDICDSDICDSCCAFCLLLSLYHVI